MPLPSSTRTICACATRFAWRQAVRTADVASAAEAIWTDVVRIPAASVGANSAAFFGSAAFNCAVTSTWS